MRIEEDKSNPDQERASVLDGTIHFNPSWIIRRVGSDSVDECRSCKHLEGRRVISIDKVMVRSVSGASDSRAAYDLLLYDPDSSERGVHLIDGVLIGKRQDTIESRWMKCNSKELATYKEDIPDTVLEWREDYPNALTPSQLHLEPQQTSGWSHQATDLVQKAKIHAGDKLAKSYRIFNLMDSSPSAGNATSSVIFLGMSLDKFVLDERRAYTHVELQGNLTLVTDVSVTTDRHEPDTSIPWLCSLPLFHRLFAYQLHSGST